jgi:hypothetical protein
VWHSRALQGAPPSEEHGKIVQGQKRRGDKMLASAAFVADDWADDPRGAHNPSNPIASLAIKGRHKNRSLFPFSQKMYAISPVVRINATGVLLWRATSL